MTLYRPWQRKEADTWNLIGECYFNLKNYQKASIAFCRAASLCDQKEMKDFLDKRSKLMNDIFIASFKK